MAESPIETLPSKRKADEIVDDEVEEDEEGETTDSPLEPEFKKVKTEDQPEDKPEGDPAVAVDDKRWNADMEMPKEKSRPHFLGESDARRRSGSGTVDDPLIVWLGKMPKDSEIKEANEDIARRTALELGLITHVYIRCAAQSSKFVDRDGKRIPIWNPDTIAFQHETKEADPHLSLAFGTNSTSLVLYGYVNVTVDEEGKPIDFATSRIEDHVVDGDDRILEIFEYEATQQDCAPYCSKHVSREKLINTCPLAQARGCPRHDMDGLLDHWCPRAHWRTEIYGDHYCPCLHDISDLEDHYCPCHHDRLRWMENRNCPHKISWNARLTHYCPHYPV
ncbi:uncharacterized protein GGS25DRAFT_526465 [Hypoxylon fragiforme]|uniref:uncharacterized protein n=1 Tax=Hypoxylon fragiforme TaxID=63214 RepID=UPI0020C729EA|nr:uncharacterized protein GGS25DRAFT_526465 [Hypoxylon fragiforme]KAI2603432.1 hypothetical protein GGS25DRAFT_526465 [Hypoxylon fragiforme]